MTAETELRPVPRSTVPLGLAMGFASAGAYALNALGASLAYAEGLNPLTYILLRLLLSVLLLALLLPILGVGFRVPRPAWGPLIGTAVGIFGMGYGYLSAVAFIPVSLAVLIFYTFPLLVGAAEALVDRKPLGLVKTTCYLVAFCGLALSLGPDFGNLDWRGLVLALSGAASAVLCLLASRRLAFALQPLGVSFYSALLSLGITAVLLLTVEPLALPTTGQGWLLAGGACLFYVIGLALQFLAIRHITAGQLAMMFNFEPAVTVVVALAFLGAALSPIQMVGVVLILAALFVSARRG